MARWQDRFLGLSQLPADLSDMELEEFFRFTPRDIRAIRETFRPQYRIPAAIQLGFVRMTGSRLNDFKVLPRNLLDFIGAQVEQPAPSIASLRTLYKRERTRFHHQVWAMERKRPAVPPAATTRRGLYAAVGAHRYGGWARPAVFRACP